MKNLETYKQWLKFLTRTKSTLDSLGYIEVVTSTLVSTPAMEAYLHGFKVEDELLYLPTSPEFSLKKIWLTGDKEFSKIFEVSKSFRAKEDHSPFHLSEFTMLEFYDSSLRIEDFIKFSSKLVSGLLDLPESMTPQVISLPELFKTLTGQKLEPDYKIEDYQKLCKALNVEFTKEDSLNDLFQRLYLEILEPSLSPKDFIVLKDYPPFLAALAKANKDGWADRFEIFYMGLELSNGYNETFDADLIKKRWSFENGIREELGFRPHPMDHELLEATSNCQFNEGCGVAIGLERVFLLSERLQGREVSILDTKA